MFLFVFIDRAKRVTVDKNGIAAASRLKPSQWKELVGEFEKFGLGKKVSKASAKEYSEPDNLEPGILLLNYWKRSSNLTILFSDQQNILKKNYIEEYEDYEVWKKRILDEAYAAVKKEQESV